VIQDWRAKWYSDAHYAEFVQEDVKIRKAIESKYREAAISLMEIERQAKDVTVTLYTARPGIVIGRGGQRVDEMRLYLEGLIGKRVRLNVQEIRQPELDAYLVARAIAEQIERRVAYRRAMKQATFRTIQAGAKGVRISCSGRLGDAEIARRQTMHDGQVPLHTLRADIDYGFTEARTTLGRIGVKVWIYKGEILPEAKVVEVEAAPGVSVTEEAAEVAVADKEEEKPEEPVVEEAAEAVVVVKEEEKPEAEEITRVAPAAKLEKKSAKPRASRTKKATVPPEPEVKSAEPATRRRKKKTTDEEPEAKVAEPAADVTAETEPSTVAEKEEKDGATT